MDQDLREELELIFIDELTGIGHAAAIGAGLAAMTLVQRAKKKCEHLKGKPEYKSCYNRAFYGLKQKEKNK